jgi:hypothetical protein
MMRAWWVAREEGRRMLLTVDGYDVESGRDEE